MNQNRNNFRTNTHTLRGQKFNSNRASDFNNRNFQNQAGLRRNFAGQRQSQFGSGNLQRTTVIRRPLFSTVNDNFDQDFNDENNQVYDGDFDQSNAALRVGGRGDIQVNSRFGQSSFRRGRARFGQDNSQQGFSTSTRFNSGFNQFNDDDSSRFDAIPAFGQQENEFGFRSARLRQQGSGQFARPAFQQQTASLLEIEQRGNAQRLSVRNKHDLDVEHSDLYHASPLTSGVAGKIASYIFKS